MMDSHAAALASAKERGTGGSRSRTELAETVTGVTHYTDRLFRFGSPVRKASVFALANLS